MDVYDEERPTLPFPIAPVTGVHRIGPPRLFDTETELFLSNAPTLPEFLPPGVPARDDEEPADDDEAPPTWPEQPGRSLVRWVVAAMAICLGVLAGAFIAPLM